MEKTASVHCHLTWQCGSQPPTSRQKGSNTETHLQRVFLRTHAFPSIRGSYIKLEKGVWVTQLLESEDGPIGGLGVSFLGRISIRSGVTGVRKGQETGRVGARPWRMW